ncbi:hypothetical protein BDZ89DRAFT_1161893 [Hymenopellis radicata]|nr:hypothetical protein BDZ89DRAFT_1161893 [Hymenopellis radicata]
MHKSGPSSSSASPTPSSSSSPKMNAFRSSPPIDYNVVIDSFAPRPLPSVELSPASSSGSLGSSDFSSTDSHLSATPSIEAFLVTRSRVVRFLGLPDPPERFLADVLFSPNYRFPAPLNLWTVHDGTIWAVFKSHDEACTALSLSGLAAHVRLAPALEHDLEPFHKLRRVDLLDMHKTQRQQQPVHRPQMLQIPPLRTQLSRYSPDNASRHDFTISSNPPNPRTNFRLGDWICASPKCGAHNFGRNLACIGCGSSKTTSPHFQPAPPPARPLPSPRFTSSPNSQASFSPSSTYSPSSPAFPPSPAATPAKNAHPLLTPSGRAFAVGGRVQNISSDPLLPCIMYWPDNEPFPEQGQIRPSGLVGVAQPPILNTGNRGPISHQPGDWICQKCNYLNWRRRKVCQTCLPYAEGNGDSISAAVQAERIALLTSVLAQTHIQAPQRSHSMTPPQVHRPFINTSPPHVRAQVHRSQSHFELGSQYASTHQAARPIYQTSGHVHAPAPAPLLPSFLQDIVQSPMLSPVSTSSADLSFDEYDERPTTQHRTQTSAKNISNIWKMDGEEFSAINRSRKSSRERLNVV